LSVEIEIPQAQILFYLRGVSICFLVYPLKLSKALFKRHSPKNKNKHLPHPHSRHTLALAIILTKHTKHKTHTHTKNTHTHSYDQRERNKMMMPSSPLYKNRTNQTIPGAPRKKPVGESVPTPWDRRIKMCSRRLTFGSDNGLQNDSDSLRSKRSFSAMHNNGKQSTSFNENDVRDGDSDSENDNEAETGNGNKQQCRHENEKFLTRRKFLRSYVKRLYVAASSSVDVATLPSPSSTENAQKTKTNALRVMMSLCSSLIEECPDESISLLAMATEKIELSK